MFDCIMHMSKHNVTGTTKNNFAVIITVVSDS